MKDNLQDLLKEAVRKREAAGRASSTRALTEEVRKAEQTHPRGMQFNPTIASRILRGIYPERLSDGTIRAVAFLAGVREEIAFAAADRAEPGPPFGEELPPGVDDLTPADRRAAVAILRQLVAQRHEIMRLESGSETSGRTKTPIGEIMPKPRRRKYS